MPKVIKITCDNCEKDLTYSRGGIDYCLVLDTREYGPNSNVILAYASRPEIDETKYFCGIGCLKLWIEKNSKTQK